jgi:DNA repair protein RadC
VFQPGVLIGASGIIVAHNHPSGDPHPSAEDLAVTKQLAAGARLLALPLLDHMILTDDPKVFYSFQQQGTM